MTTTIDCDYIIDGDGPPLFLIHGIGAARDTWRFVAPQLTPHYTIISYDLRGHGTSPKPDGEFGLDDLVNDLERVRERTGIENAHFAGHSLGGMIGPAYARKHPDRILSVGLLNTAAGRTEDDSVKVWAACNAVAEKGAANVLPMLIDRWYTDAFIKENPEIVQRRLDQIVNMDQDVFNNVFRIYAGTEMLPWLHEIIAPCLVLTSENDGGCSPRVNKLIDEALPNSKLVVLPNDKHATLLEAPDEVAAEMLRFLKQVGS
ncbi:MAG: alpha/beta fold hydrolase [Hyphomicrobiaceae bacterium]